MDPFVIKGLSPHLLEDLRDGIEFFALSILPPVGSIEKAKVAIPKATAEVLRRIDAIEARIAASTTKGFTASAKKSLSKNLRLLARKGKKPTTAAVNSFLNGLEKDLSAGVLTPTRAASTMAGIHAIVRMTKAEYAKSLGIPAQFNMVDKRTVAVLQNHNTFWVNGFYSEQLGSRISAVTREVMLEKGLGTKEAAKRLQPALERELGIKPGGKTSLASHVPARFAGDPDRYFQIVANSAAQRARSISTVTSFQTAGVTTYTLVNPGDERTSKVCNKLNGREFPVSNAVAARDKILAAENPEDIKSITPWLTAKEVTTTADKGGEKALAAKGVLIPPFHGKCRTQLVASSSPAPKWAKPIRAPKPKPKPKKKAEPKKPKPKKKTKSKPKGKGKGKAKRTPPEDLPRITVTRKDGEQFELVAPDPLAVNPFARIKMPKGVRPAELDPESAERLIYFMEEHNNPRKMWDRVLAEGLGVENDLMIQRAAKGIKDAENFVDRLFWDSELYRTPTFRNQKSAAWKRVRDFQNSNQRVRAASEVVDATTIRKKHYGYHATSRVQGEVYDQYPQAVQQYLKRIRLETVEADWSNFRKLYHGDSSGLGVDNVAGWCEVSNFSGRIPGGKPPHLQRGRIVSRKHHEGGAGRYAQHHTHEMSHYLDYRLLDAQAGGHAVWDSKSHFMGAFPKNEFVSNYAKTNGGEMWADSLSMAFTGFDKGGSNMATLAPTRRKFFRKLMSSSDNFRRGTSEIARIGVERNPDTRHKLWKKFIGEFIK